MKLFDSFRIIIPFVLIQIGCIVSEQTDGNTRNDSFTPLSEIEEAFNNHTSDMQILQEGIIISVLPDDTEGDRHQRVIVRLENNQTLLIVHNIDLAPRIPDLQTGKPLRFFGEYEWNDEGGIIHWTHKDPQGKHVDGWLEYAGKRYE